MRHTTNRTAAAVILAGIALFSTSCSGSSHVSATAQSGPAASSATQSAQATPTAAQSDVASTSQPQDSASAYPSGLVPAGKAPVDTHALSAISPGLSLSALASYEKQHWGISLAKKEQEGTVRPDMATWLAGSAKQGKTLLSVWVWLNQKQEVTYVRCSFDFSASAEAEKFIDDCAGMAFSGTTSSKAIVYVQQERAAIAALDSTSKDKEGAYAAPARSFGRNTYSFTSEPIAEVLNIRGEVSVG
jgi:hypothetical protein